MARSRARTAWLSAIEAEEATLGREQYNATLVRLVRVHDELLVLRLRPDAPLPVYAAGQWLQVGLGSWEPRCTGSPAETPATPETLLRKPYSLSCAILADADDRLVTPDEHDWYELYICFDRARATGTSGHALAARFAALAPGARLWVDEAPRGNYSLEPVQPEDDVLFLATGTGEAPHNRMIWELLRRGHSGRIAAVVTARQRADLGYRGVHERLMRLFPNYRWTGIATRESGQPGGRLQTLLASGALEASAGFALDPARSHVFLCGNADMLGRPRLEDGRAVYPQPAGMIELLERRGHAHVHFERY